MLETVREFALEQLAASGEAGKTRRRHAEFYLGLVQRAAPHLTGPEQAQWLGRLDCEYSNIRAVLERARAGSVDAAILSQFAVALWRYWNVRGYCLEGGRTGGTGRGLLPAGSGAVRTGERPPGHRPLPGMEVAGLVALGRSNRQIAQRLFISEHTVATHVQHILGKLEFSSRTQIATWAVQRGVKPPA